MLATLIPLFDKDLKVFAYSLFSQKDDLLKNPGMQGFGRNDGFHTLTSILLICPHHTIPAGICQAASLPCQSAQSALLSPAVFRRKGEKTGRISISS